MTYAMQARPHARASVQGSTRCVQMLMVAVAVQGGAAAFGTVGQGYTGVLGVLVISMCVGLGATVKPLQEQPKQPRASSKPESVYGQATSVNKGEIQDENAEADDASDQQPLIATERRERARER